MPALVLDPSATRAKEGAVDDGREERSADVHEEGAEGERGAQLEASVREVEPGGLEEALLLELRAPTGEILEHRGVRIGAPRGLRGPLGRALSIFQAFGERMWNSLNASAASAPVLESM